ncbi:hypothetical protein PALB_32750 [Pseudoalteromonas luteoviolacea B = ATCC 29581]|nr:hypothetical protein PALB_32750 [Pseudoalteromonas luteoviolacea B = ATCC 29581]
MHQKINPLVAKSIIRLFPNRLISNHTVGLIVGHGHLPILPNTRAVKPDLSFKN